MKKSAVKKMMTKEEKKDGAVPDMSIKNEAAKQKWREKGNLKRKRDPMEESMVA